LSIAFGSLIVLIALLGVGSIRRARQTYAEVASLYETNRQTERILSDIRADIHASGIFVRDYLLDPSHIAGAYHRAQLLEMRGALSRNLDALERQIGREDASRLRRLREELDGYWETLDPLFEWTPKQKLVLSYSFLRQQVLPRRNAVLAMAREIRELADAGLRAREQALRQRERAFRLDLAWMLGVAVALGLLVAGVSLFRISRLERRSEEHRRRTEQAERELRQLSRQLVQAQEEERKAISRELHDEVGQMLTALRMDLGGLERMGAASTSGFEERLASTKRLTEDTLRAVRDLSLGLRPSMLDDLGLGPALEWQAREFSRRSGTPVNVRLEGNLAGLPEAHRTCVFRVVQEALTNCARHAEARDIRVGVHGHAGSLFVTVEDDGAGMPEGDAHGRGIGLIGIQERVRQLGGSLEIFSQPGRGTALKVTLPVKLEVGT
jgi:signal transduction histidine kinase